MRASFLVFTLWLSSCTATETNVNPVACGDNPAICEDRTCASIDLDGEPSEKICVDLVPCGGLSCPGPQCARIPGDADEVYCVIDELRAPDAGFGPDA